MQLLRLPLIISYVLKSTSILHFIKSPYNLANQAKFHYQKKYSNQPHILKSFRPDTMFHNYNYVYPSSFELFPLRAYIM